MIIRSTKGLTFDDVLLVPQRSSVASRRDVDTSTCLTPTIRLRLPIVSANMDTVTESTMAIAMARAGGIGIVHRFMTMSTQVEHVKRVKRAEGFMVEQPRAIAQQASLAEAKRLMDQYEVGGLVVTDGSAELVGLVTKRDLLLAPDDEAAERDPRHRATPWPRRVRHPRAAPEPPGGRCWGEPATRARL